MTQPIKTSLLTALCAFSFSQVLSQDAVKISEKTIEIPTYLMGKPDPNPYFYTGAAYQGAQQRIYPYAFGQPY